MSTLSIEITIGGNTETVNFTETEEPHGGGGGGGTGGGDFNNDFN